jgi:hypothetical protein
MDSVGTRHLRICMYTFYVLIDYARAHPRLTPVNCVSLLVTDSQVSPNNTCQVPEQIKIKQRHYS